MNSRHLSSASNSRARLESEVLEGVIDRVIAAQDRDCDTTRAVTRLHPATPGQMGEQPQTRRGELPKSGQRRNESIRDLKWRNHFHAKGGDNLCG